jgi:hypothetical protein
MTDAAFVLVPRAALPPALALSIVGVRDDDVIVPIGPALGDLEALDLDPPPAAANTAAVFDLTAGAWLTLPDHRGERWWADQVPVYILDEQLGRDPEAEGLTREPGPMPIEVARESKRLEMDAACSRAITGGFTSEALGPQGWRYGNSLVDQVNLLGSVLAVLSLGSASSPLTCRNAAGEWALRPHSAAQIVAVGEDGKAWVVACREHLAVLRAQINGATTAAEVLALTWTDPA